MRIKQEYTVVTPILTSHKTMEEVTDNNNTKDKISFVIFHKTEPKKTTKASEIASPINLGFRSYSEKSEKNKKQASFKSDQGSM